VENFMGASVIEFVLMKLGLAAAPIPDVFSTRPDFAPGVWRQRTKAVDAKRDRVGDLPTPPSAFRPRCRHVDEQAPLGAALFRSR
jgi:hypothetical protein